MRAGRHDFPDAVTSVNQFPNDGCAKYCCCQGYPQAWPRIDLGSREVQGSFENTQSFSQWNSPVTLPFQQADLYLYLREFLCEITIVISWELNITICLAFLLLHFIGDIQKPEKNVGLQNICLLAFQS